ncbi:MULTISPECIES: TIGR03364 family FAD-dependent oxidoreductase [unclassified Sphingobium]|uniref:TIGR03364 family FAD-dependent oxidoreductase n=1 Tax=unclassified Sphingobium TaxID=2611147 RepID=UPI002224119C|nr:MULTISPECIES: TIGR03364 family FAD-dependent oxidoreductase [unclassified Sphingobium]MCW2410722.1 FAD dependent oxidoreductase TIGR03364 [Sphingobium sp. B8D3D]MCW2416988.1 FAD dependent oxidoreductase TIGR03364 [Sphingobium sp. B8D3A]
MASLRVPDLIIVGAGIVGLAHALAAVKRGLMPLVVDRDAQANGASIRNFGFVTVTGQERGKVWSLARRSAQVWREVAPQAGIAIEQEGLLLLARRPEAADVLHAFQRTEMGEQCSLLDRAQVSERFPMLQGCFSAALLSGEDLRVESRTAIPLLARWLADAHSIDFQRGTAVRAVETGVVHLADGRTLKAPHIIVCPGDDLVTLFPQEIAQARVTRSFLQMLRLVPPGWRLPAPVMSDLSMVRYLGYAALPEAAALEARLRAEAAEALNYGIHLIVVQSADGSLVVGDSHSYGATPPPFASAVVDSAIIAQFVQIFGAAPPVTERWTGTYASGSGHSLVREPMPGVRLVIVTSGTGASTSFALAEDVVDRILSGGDSSNSGSEGKDLCA